ncbi:MAG: DUF1963 domain-containing protein [Akkermansia sp.]|nr:DUF1963 domain-containing protein [Akkermansia sp.]
MKKRSPIFYYIGVVAGISLLVSKLVSRVFGLKETLLTNVGMFIAYELVILLLVSLGVYVYHRRKSTVPAAIPGKTKKEKKHRAVDERVEAAIWELRNTLRKNAVVLRSTAATERPEGQVSCLGRVTWQLPGEECPVDEEGNPLQALATIFVPTMPEVPAALSQVALITIFAPVEAWSEDSDEKPTLGCVFRVYSSLEGLVPCDYVSEELKTCVLTPEAVTNDMPKWPDCGGGEATWDRILALEKKHKIDYQEDICNILYMNLNKEKFPARFEAAPAVHAIYETHKIGGYPTYAQDAPEMPEGYEFVMQINYDDEAELYIGDCGSYYFYYHAEKNDWRVYADCY